MRIGVDARLMFHRAAGISNYTWHLLQALQTLDTQNEYIIFQHRRHQQPLIDHANFRRATLYAPVHSRLEQWMLPIELLPHKLTLLHSTDFIPPLRSTIPTVITVHDLAFLHWPHFLTADSAAYYGQIDRAVRRARHVIVPSESTKRDLIAQLGAPQSKVSVIYEAAAPSFVPLPIAPTRQAVIDHFRLPSNYVLFVGTLEPRKNIDGLLQAFHHLRTRCHSEPGHAALAEVGLVIVGRKGWLFEETLATVTQLNLQQHTYFLDRVDDEWLHKLYVGARCLVHPAHYEGFGLPPLEAMACGTPAIVSNVSSLPEVVHDAALLIDPKEPEEIALAMARLLTDDQLHAELRAKGLQRARCFSWETAARQTLAVYQQVAARGVSQSLPVTSATK